MTPCISGGKRGFSPESGERPADNFLQQLGAGLYSRMAANETEATRRLAERLSALYSSLEPMAKSTVAVVAICYAFGLVIKNTYLARWSSFSADFVDVEYVLTGALFLFLVSAGTALWALTLGMIYNTRKAWYKGHRGRATWRIIRSFILGSAAITVILAFLLRDYSWHLVVAALIVIGLPAAGLLLRKRLLVVWRRLIWNTDTRGEIPILFFVVALGSFFAIYVYINTIYTRVSPAYGGGQPILIELRVDNDGYKTLTSVDLKPMLRDSEPIFIAELIFEDDECLTIVAPCAKPNKSAVARLERRNIVSIVVRQHLPCA